MSSVINVNLLSGKASEIRQERAIKSKLQFITAFILVCFLGFIVVIFGISTYVNVRLNKIKSQAETEIQKIGQMAYVEDTYLVLQNKVALLASYFSLKPDVFEAVEDLKNTIPKDVTLTGFMLDNATKVITLSFEAKSYQPLNNFLDLAMNKVDTNVFSKINFDGITRKEDGSYGTNLALIFNSQ